MGSQHTDVEYDKEPSCIRDHEVKRYGVSPFAHWTIISYNLLLNESIHSALLSTGFDMVIFDEAHYLKTVTSGRSQAALGSLDGSKTGLIEVADRITCLTGTPLPNRPREAYNLARHIDWRSIDGLSEDGFIRRFNPSQSYKSGFTEEYTSRAGELGARMRCNFMVRRLRREVLTQLPAEIHELVHLDTNTAMNKALRAERLLDIEPDELENASMETRGHIARVRHEMGIAKVPRCLEHIQGVLDADVPKIFIVCYHRAVINLILKKLADYQPALIWGSQTPKKRDAEKARFIEDPKCRIMVGQLNAVAEALDGMQHVCWHGIFVEASWTPKDNDQVCGRLVRMGQTEAVVWQYLVAPEGLDEKILGTSIEKARTINHTLDKRAKA